MEIKKAKKIDAKNLTSLTIRSKSYWNYGRTQIEEWRDELTITAKYIEENQVYKLINNRVLVGFYAYNLVNETDVKLNYLFIESEFIGKGYGKILMLDFLNRIENLEFNKIVLDADPNAEKFYSKFGFRVIGKLKSSIKDRYLPIMAKEL